MKGSFELTVGQVLTYGSSFVRLAILARILTKADFGVTAMFAMTVALLEMSSNMSLNMLIVQSKDGDDPSFQGTAHLLQATRGIIIGMLLFLLAWPVSHFFNIPETRWAFQCLAIVPLLKGFVHLDINRLERTMNFRPRIVVEVIPQILITIAAWPMAVWLKDYSALLWLLVARAVFTLIASHVIAERPYRWTWRRAYFRDVIRFAWPLLLNGVLLFLIGQGDRFLVGATLSMENLGLYAAASALAWAVGTMVHIVHGTVMLPILAARQNDQEEFRRYYHVSARVLMLVTTVMGTAFILGGAPLIVLVYGS